jgi:hypothetical protein
MKPFLGINLTTDKKNKRVNGDEFVVARPSLASAQSLGRSAQGAKETMEKSQLPVWLRIAQVICGVVGVICAYAIIKALIGRNVTLQDGYSNAPWAFWLCGGGILMWFLLWFIGKRREKDVLGSDEGARSIQNLKVNTQAVYAELSVPGDAESVDVMMFYYKEKKVGIKPCEKGVQLWTYFNPSFRIFTDENMLYLANTEGKYGIPLSDIKSIRTVKKNARLQHWNKDERFNSEKYKPYKLMPDNYGCINCRCYHIIELDHNGEQWGIYIPSYELPVFEKMTGLKAEA